MSLFTGNSTNFTGEPPYTIYLGETHVVEVKKGGLYIGVYLITPTLARRGLILPRTVWKILIEQTLTINSAIDSARKLVLEKSTSKNGKQNGRRILSNQSEYVPPTLQSYFHYFPNEGPAYQQQTSLPFTGSIEQFEQYGFTVIPPTETGGECQPEDLTTTEQGKSGGEAQWGDSWLTHTT